MNVKMNMNMNMNIKKILFKIAILSIPFLCCGHFSLAAKDYVLFRHGEFSSDYNSIIGQIMAGKLEKGDRLLFSKGAFTFDHYINAGGTTIIVSIGDGKVLRIPRTSEIRYDGEYGESSKVDRDYLKDYVRTNSQLRGEGVPVIKVFPEESMGTKNSFGELEYVLAEEVKVDFTFDQFSAEMSFYQSGEDENENKEELSPRLHLSRKKIKEILQQLQDFIKSTYKLVEISDLHTGNLAYIEGKWVVLDYGGSVKYFYPPKNESAKDAKSDEEDSCWKMHVLDRYMLPSQVQEELGNIVKNLRQGQS